MNIGKKCKKMPKKLHIIACNVIISAYHVVAYPSQSLTSHTARAGSKPFYNCFKHFCIRVYSYNYSQIWMRIFVSLFANTDINIRICIQMFVELFANIKTDTNIIRNFC